jgi:hypothetical protein
MDGPAVRCEHGARMARRWGGAWRRENRGVSGVTSAWGKLVGLGQHVTSGGGAAGGADAEAARSAGAASWCDDALAETISDEAPLSTFFSKILNRSVPNDE